MGTKPNAQLTGDDGNIFMVAARASKALKRAGLEKQAAEMKKRVSGSATYDEALAVILEYVDDGDDDGSRPVAVCRACLEGAHMGGEPDFPYRVVEDEAACEADDHGGE